MAYHRFMFFVVLSLCSSLSKSAYDNVFISIDCGSSLSFPYRDKFGVDWVGDEEYVQSGKSTSVGASDSIGHVADTLRVFTTRKKNCYNIGSVKPGRVLLRAKFYYGNYDGKDSPPTFALQFDGNNWTQVLTSSTVYYYYEVTYTMKRDSISVCLAQTVPGQFPFITALEVRCLEPNMYRHVNDSYPLFHLGRVSFGLNETIRYPNDPYDRIWGPGPFSNQSTPVSSDASFSEPASPYDRPPPAVLKNAITSTAPNASIELLMEFPSYKIPVYINWYFSEVTMLEPGQNRSFRIFKDNESFSGPILPPYGDCLEMRASNISVSNETMFSLVPTNDSTLPPVINAMEVFRIGKFKLTDGTNKKDVEGLASLQESFRVLQSWSGDPCLPSDYPWEWVKCNGDPTPRVTSLLLGDYGLSGFLPDFSSMDALQTIDLYNNSLRGPIPEFLGTLPKLRTLNLASNRFNGTVPPSLSAKNGLTLKVTGNPDLCTASTSCHSLATVPPNSSIKEMKNILQLLIVAMISFVIVSYSRDN